VTVPAEPRRTVVVVAGVLVEHERVLLTQRPAGTHLAGFWELPGGKVEPDEDPRAALARELHEELGVEVDVLDVVDVSFHRYEEKSVLLLFYRVQRRPGSAEPRALGVAACSWRTAGELLDGEVAPADVPALARIRTLLGG
jgi:8-oxo-dGTP diphosphatase